MRSFIVWSTWSTCYSKFSASFLRHLQSIIVLYWVPTTPSCPQVFLRVQSIFLIELLLLSPNFPCVYFPAIAWVLHRAPDTPRSRPVCFTTFTPHLSRIPCTPSSPQFTLHVPSSHPFYLEHLLYQSFPHLHFRVAIIVLPYHRPILIFTPILR